MSFFSSIFPTPEQKGTHLLEAITSRNKQKAILLIKKGADINAKDRYGKTALHNASQWGKPETVQLLIKKGADVNAKSIFGETALQKAVEFAKRDWSVEEEKCFSEVFQILKNAGAKEK